MQLFIQKMIQSAQTNQNFQHALHILNKTAETFSLDDNLLIFGQSLETLSYISHSKSCRLEQFCDCFSSWHGLIATVQDQKTNLLNSLNALIDCTASIDTYEFDQQTFMVITQKSRDVYQKMDESSRLRFLCNINSNIDEKNESYRQFALNMQDNFLEDVVTSASLKHIDAYTNYIAQLLESDQVRRPVTLLIQKITVLLTLPVEL